MKCSKFNENVTILTYGNRSDYIFGLKDLLLKSEKLTVVEEFKRNTKWNDPTWGAGTAFNNQRNSWMR